MSQSCIFLVTTLIPIIGVSLSKSSNLWSIYTEATRLERVIFNKEKLKFGVQSIKMWNKMNPTLTLFLFIRNPAKRILPGYKIG